MTVKIHPKTTLASAGHALCAAAPDAPTVDHHRYGECQEAAEHGGHGA